MTADLQQPTAHPPRSPTDIFGDPMDSEQPWFQKSAFLSPEFDPESYIADLRTFVPLDSLRSELRSHLSSLKADLVDHLNRDYADFVSLSTRLVDVDASVARMRSPLSELRDKIAALRDSLASSLAALRGGLAKRAEASEARGVLELLLDAFHVVSKVEKLIKELPNVSNTKTVVSDNGLASNDTSLQQIETGSNLRETQSILLERIASEMNRLKFYITNSKNLPFIENIEKRIQSASSLLDGSLRQCFVDGLEHRDANVIYNCLRAYAAIDNIAGAEEIFRTTIVSPLIRKIVPHEASQFSANMPNELDGDYRQIMECIEKDCRFLLDISSSANSGLHVFDFLANSILKEVLHAIQKGKPGALSPGRPTEFLKNYKSSLGFLAYLEGFCSSLPAVTKFRQGSVYAEFMKLWNMGVYFSLRFQEIAGTLDSVLMSSTITIVQSLDQKEENLSGLTLKQSTALLESLRSCWKEDVLVFSSSDKFLRLCLQLISRYMTWLSSGLAARKASGTNPNLGSDWAIADWAIAASPEDFVYVLHDVRCLVTELSGGYTTIVLQLFSSCSHEVLKAVNESFVHALKSLEDVIPAIVDAMTEAIVEKSIEDLKQLKGITAIYRMTNKPPPVRHSPYVSGVLRPLKVPATADGSSFLTCFGRQKACCSVALDDFRRLGLYQTTFLEGERASYLSNTDKTLFLTGACERITGRYYELASEVVSVARKTESSLQRIRQGAQRRTGATSDLSDSNISDADKICMQLFLDIQEYGRSLASLGFAAAETPIYRSLWQCVAPPEKESDISF